jgi:alpha-ketoglutarate-dependent taurine dioxygenase
MLLLFQRVAPRIEAKVAALSDSHLALLRSRGWVLVEYVGGREQCEQLLRELGELQPQYGGSVRHEVRFRPGFDDLQYSQSANAITPHTEGPGHGTPPRYLALHCHRQARCGGGSTVLADAYELLDSLPDALRSEVERRPIRFDLAAEGANAEAAPVLSAHEDGTRIVRFSHNVMRDGRLEGPARKSDDLEGVDPFHAELCRRGAEFMRTNGVVVLAPDDGLLIFDNWRMLHSRDRFDDRSRHLTRYWLG